MFKKFNWGWGIALVYGGFVVFIGAMVMLANRQRVDLVTPDYYAKELQYQQQLDKMNNSAALGQPVVCKTEGHTVRLEFPQKLNGKDIKANVFFYRPNNSDNDFSISCTPDADGSCLIQSDKFKPGKYQMQVEWSANGVSYYNENTVNIN